jgi:hypothetical protein
MTPEETTQLLSRIAALEYLLERGYATWVSQMSESEITEFEKDFETNLSTTWAASQVEPFSNKDEFDVGLVRDVQGRAIRFWKRVREQEATIRKRRTA